MSHTHTHTHTHTHILFVNDHRYLSTKQAIAYVQKSIAHRQTLQDLIDSQGNIWDSNKISDGIQIGNPKSIAISTATDDKWHVVAALLPYASGRRYFEMKILQSGETTNSWKVG